MSALRVAQATWGTLSPSERRSVLDQIKAVSPAWASDGKSPGVLCYLDDFDDLPSDICGRLIMAITDAGFDMKEYEKARDILISGTTEPGETG